MTGTPLCRPLVRNVLSHVFKKIINIMNYPISLTASTDMVRVPAPTTKFISTLGFRKIVMPSRIGVHEVISYGNDANRPKVNN